VDERLHGDVEVERLDLPDLLGLRMVHLQRAEPCGPGPAGVVKHLVEREGGARDLASLSERQVHDLDLVR
jgi:hypothetical protein